MLSVLTPNFALMKAWQNWVLVALVFFLTGVVFHLFAQQMMGSNQQGSN